MVDGGIQPAEWGTAVPAEVLDHVEEMLGVRLPEAWRGYVRRDRWLRRGWLESGSYVQLDAPDEALAIMAAWGEALDLHAGFYLLGGDGSRDMYCLDLRDHEPMVQLTDITSSGWRDAQPTNLSVAQFVAAIDEGSFPAVPVRPRETRAANPPHETTESAYRQDRQSGHRAPSAA
jgi:hypothetical protein